MDAIEKLIGPSGGTITESPAWRAALAEPDRRKWPPIADGHPEAGYYRVKDGGKWVPIKYLYERGELYCCIGVGEDWLDLDEAIEKFTWAWPNPISRETYEIVMKGGNWPDVDPEVERQMGKRGDNKPPATEGEDPILADLTIDLENALEAAKRYAKIENDQTSEAALSARNRLNEIANKLKKRHRELKAPVLAQGKKLDADYLRPADSAEAAALVIRRAMGAWETQKANAAREAAEAARRAEEEAQREADRAIADGVPPSAMETLNVPAPELAPVPAPATQIRSGYGRAAHVGVVKKIDQITDYRALALAYIERETVKAAIMKCAEQDVKNGHQPPGVTIKEEIDVR